ncbi:MAG: hypothetical protein HS128_20655 [Ideonella sp.]|nr:hypothetical protein [Ideonella sp.]MCC7459064.1 hypothetical protein [Nitrospira sp.]
MAISSNSRRSSHGAPAKERRARADAAAPLRKLKGALARPLVIERRDGKLQLALVERRRARSARGEASVAQLCTELSARLLAHGAEQAARSMRELIFVHDALERGGWAGVATLSPLVLGQALQQLEKLAVDEPAAPMTALLDGLRPLLRVARQREARESLAHEFRVGDNLEVSESDFTAFEVAEDEWVATMPSDFVPRPGRDE